MAIYEQFEFGEGGIRKLTVTEELIIQGKQTLPNTTLTAASTLTAADSGKTFFLNLAGGFATTLPAPAAGLKFTFIVKTAPTTAYTIVTSGSANIIVGQQHDAGGAAGDTGATDDTISFVANQAVAGDRVDLISDGTSWFAYGFTKVAAGMTFTTAS